MTQGLNPHLLHYRHILYCWVTWEGHILIRGRQKGVLHTHTHARKDDVKMQAENWSNEATAKKCWQVPKDGRETKDGPFNAWMEKELMWRSQRWWNDRRISTKGLKGNVRGEENHRWMGKTETGSWVMNTERQNGVVSRFWDKTDDWKESQLRFITLYVSWGIFRRPFYY